MSITAQEIVGRIQQKLGPGWKDTPVDVIMAGKPDTAVTGVVTTFAPSMEVLKKAVAAKQNMIISRESPFWFRSAVAGGGAGRPPDGTGPGNERKMPPRDPVFQTKQDYIAANNLVVYRLYANWNAQAEDMQLKGLAKALGWEKYYKPSGGQPWAYDNGFFEVPPATLKDTALHLKKKLNIKSIRVGGSPTTMVRKVAVYPGTYWLNDLEKIFAEPNVDVLIAGEPKWENELAPYIFDQADNGQNKGMIMLGEEVSQDPGCGEMATWLKSFIADVPVQWIPTGEPCWMPY
jgi:putative NIF3 family GTP cyclohydrolase 1 type 2